MRNSLAIFVPSMGGHDEAVRSWQETMSQPWPLVIDNHVEGEEAGFLAKCERGWRQSEADVVGFLHSDLVIHEKGWDRRVLAEFDNDRKGDQKVAVVGFVGGKRLGSDDLGLVPYHFSQLARGDVISNLTDAESHGRRDAQTCEVAVLDSCAIFVRRSLLADLSGWPVARYPNSSHCSDLWICLATRERGLAVRFVGVGCTHRSGGKGQAGSEWLDQRGGDEEGFHRPAHRLVYDEFRHLLPVRVGS